jgi:hypothetical protein
MNPNYNLQQVYAVEQVIDSQNLTDAISTSHPLLATLLQNGAANNPLSFTVEDSLMGLKAVAPILGAVGNAEGVTKAGQYTAMSVTEASSANVNFAEYPFSTYRANFSMDYREVELLKNGETRGLNKVNHEVARMKAGFNSAMASHLYGTSAATEGALIGVVQPLASANTVGGISQTSFSFWRSNLNPSAAGAISIDKIREGIQSARRHIVDGIETVDLILVSEKTGSKLWSKLAGLVGANQRFMETSQAKWGFRDGFLFDGAVVLPDASIAASSVVYLNSSTWFFGGDTRPTLVGGEPVRVSGTSVWEYHYMWSVVLGCKNPARNARQEGLT